VSYTGVTGWNRAPWSSANALMRAVINELGLPPASLAPTTATERGYRNVSRSTGRNAMGRPETSSGRGEAGTTRHSDAHVRFRSTRLWSRPDAAAHDWDRGTVTRGVARCGDLAPRRLR